MHPTEKQRRQEQSIFKQLIFCLVCVPGTISCLGEVNKTQGPCSSENDILVADTCKKKIHKVICRIMADSDNSCKKLSNLRGSHISVWCVCVCVCVCMRACVCARLVESQCSGQPSRWRDTWVETRIKLCWLRLQVGRIWANFRPQMWLDLMTCLTWLPFHTTSGFQASLEITVKARLGSQCPRTAPRRRECQPPASEDQCVLWVASPSHALDLFSRCRCLSSSAFVVRSANKQTKTKMSPDPKGLTVEW